MKIVLVGPGIKEIPPQGWGAVESVVWDYYCNLKNLDHQVVIVNTQGVNQIAKQVNREKADVVHIMYDDHIDLAARIKCKKIYYTSHFAYLTSPNLKTVYNGYYENIFKKVIKLKNKIHFNVLSKEIADIYIAEGFPKNEVTVVHNGAREDQFKYNKECLYKDKSIYLAKIESRKKQYLYQNIESIDFVGNYQDSNFDTNKKNYLGEWNKENLYQNLTNYSNLILLSDGEADPLVVKEALIAGLGIVVSEVASANLDLSKDFIDVIPNDKLEDIEYVEEIVKMNRLKSVDLREEIRNYAIEKFSWKNIISKLNYLN